MHFVGLESSLLPLHIAGENNQMADILLQAFKNGIFFEAHADLVTYFNLHFPLPQKLSWREFKVPTKWVSRVISCLRGEQLQMESLLKLPKLGKSVGSIGQSTATSGTRIPISTSSPPVNERCSSQPLPQGTDRGLRSRRSSRRSNGHESARGHLQDLPTGWKTKSRYTNGGKIHSSRRTNRRRI
jgi:hypothetical protein